MRLNQFHGWADPIVPPSGSPAYYTALIQFERLKGLPRAEYDAAVSGLTAAQVTADSLARAGAVQGYHPSSRRRLRTKTRVRQRA